MFLVILLHKLCLSFYYLNVRLLLVSPQRSTTLVPNCYSNLLIICSDISWPYNSYHVLVLFSTSLHISMLILSSRCLLRVQYYLFHVTADHSL